MIEAGFTSIRSAPHPVVGVLDLDRQSPPTLRSIRISVSLLELRRRLAGFEVRAYTLADAPPLAPGPDVVQVLPAWGEGSARHLGQLVEAAVVLLPEAAGGAHPVVTDLTTAGITVVPASDPFQPLDPIGLAARLVPEDLLDLRLEYLRVGGIVPSSGPFILDLEGAPGGISGDGGEAVIAADPAAPVLDLLALAGAARSVTGTGPAVAALASAFDRPADGAEGKQLSDRIDARFDDLYRAVIDAAGPRLAQSSADRLAALEDRVATLEQANDALARTLGRERAVMGAEVRRLKLGGGRTDTGTWSTYSAERLSQSLSLVSQDRDRLQSEVDRIYATRTMRMVAPLRRVYRLLRRLAS